MDITQTYLLLSSFIEPTLATLSGATNYKQQWGYSVVKMRTTEFIQDTKTIPHTIRQTVEVIENNI